MSIGGWNTGGWEPAPSKGYDAGRRDGFWFGMGFTVIAQILVLCVLFLVCCEPTPEPPEARRPTISWADQGGSSVADTAALSNLLPQTYFDVGEHCAVPPRWRMFRFKVPRLGRYVAYNVFWAPEGGTFSVIGVVTPDTTESFVWVAFDDLRDGDWVALEAASE